MNKPKLSKDWPARLEHKRVSPSHIDIKAINDDGTFEGILSPYGNVDEGGDVVEPGAYTKTLAEKGTVVPLLWQHKQDIPIGELTLEDRPDGLYCKGKLLLDDPDAKKAYLYIKNRIVRGLSIGFESVKDTVEKGIRHLREIKLWEGSIVTFPMNLSAVITSVKSRFGTKGDFMEELEEIQTLAGFYQMQSALDNALRELIWSDFSREEKIAACNTILQQFAESFTEFFPAYLDTLAEVYGPSETWSKRIAERKNMQAKVGAEFSAANKDTLTKACGLISQGHDLIKALFDEDKAGKATLSGKAANEPEPGSSHSAAEDLSLAEEIEKLRALIPA